MFTSNHTASIFQIFHPKEDYHTREVFSESTVMRVIQGSIAHSFDAMFIQYESGAITEWVSYIVTIVDIVNMAIQ